jgi:7-keto-8-aminopelargonate synthetase-like enzyme
MPVMVNNDARVLAIAEKIQERGLFLNPVTYPAVPKNKSRLRISVSAAHSEDDLEAAVGIIKGVLVEEGVCR